MNYVALVGEQKRQVELTELEDGKFRVVIDGRELFVDAALCHNLKIVDDTLLGDPMEVALAGMGRQIVGALADHQRIDEIPFDTDRKRMSVLCATPQGHMLYCKGAPETVLAACEFVQFDAATDAEPVPLDPLAGLRLRFARRLQAQRQRAKKRFVQNQAGTGCCQFGFYFGFYHSGN